ncbi:MAG: ABC transporter ATP-binding protein [Alphaproteobacteria bacterium]|nr:ABC transporter ATP-binding protein [Alphaproteobacteria bacterium]MDA8005756.1 ABC transporter ATP-binding protein [Alphaproteobacteria bacterium]MDA8013177.1 ABC transporter ATP-binding protein [Alphaproteobacteria bacterium]
MAEIRLRDLTKRWGDFTAVDRLNLTIAESEFLVLLGPSGCGKTTTMRMIAGLEEATSGEIWIGDDKVNGVEPKDRDVAMVFQSYGLYPTMTVYENIHFPLRMRGVAKSERHGRVLRAAEMVELGDLLDRRPAALSGGQRQRVALARAIVREPRAFLMDEPLSNLDAKLRVSTRAQIKNLSHALRVTTIYVTHDQVEAMTLADRVVVMDGGVARQIGAPTEIYDRPANVFVAGFIGSPAMNLVRGEVAGGCFEAEHVRVAGLGGVRDGAAVLGFRAEDVLLTGAGEAATAEAPGVSGLRAPVYSVELLGESTMVTVRIGGVIVSLRAAKDFRVEIGDEVSAVIDADICHLFDAVTGDRLES